MQKQHPNFLFFPFVLLFGLSYWLSLLSRAEFFFLFFRVGHWPYWLFCRVPTFFCAYRFLGVRYRVWGGSYRFSVCIFRIFRWHFPYFPFVFCFSLQIFRHGSQWEGVWTTITNEYKRAQTQVCKRAQKGPKERKRALLCKICKQPGLKQPALGTPKYCDTLLRRSGGLGFWHSSELRNPEGLEIEKMYSRSNAWKTKKTFPYARNFHSRLKFSFSVWNFHSRLKFLIPGPVFLWPERGPEWQKSHSRFYNCIPHWKPDSFNIASWDLRLNFFNPGPLCEFLSSWRRLKSEKRLIRLNFWDTLWEQFCLSGQSALIDAFWRKPL